MLLKGWEIRNLLNGKSLNFVKNSLNYKSAEVDMSSDEMANFATLRECNLARNLLSQVLFGFLCASLDSTNQQSFKKI